MGHAGPAENAQHFSPRSCRSLLQDLVHALAQPVGAAFLGRLGQTRPDDQNVVSAGWQRLQPSAPELAKPALDPVSGHGSRDRLLRHGEAEPWLAALLFAREPIQGEKACRDRPAVPVDRIEISRTREAVAALHLDGAPTRRDACGHGRAAASGSRDRHASPSGRENRACASGGVRWADRSASRGSVKERNAASIAAAEPV
jgi:hypothetical protein